MDDSYKGIKAKKMEYCRMLTLVTLKYIAKQFPRQKVVALNLILTLGPLTQCG